MVKKIDGRNIRKHKSDVIRLSVMLTAENSIKLPKLIAVDMKKFIKVIKSEPPDFKAIGKNVGISNLNSDKIVKQIEHKFLL